MSRKDDLQFLTTDLEYSDETPQAAAPLFPDEADDTLVGKLGLFKGSRHPGVALFHVLFKSLALAVYLFAGRFTSNFVLVCVVCILLLAFDFWTVKNVSGRLLVGLRWWNYVKEDGATEWVFEAAEDKSPKSGKRRDSKKKKKSSKSKEETKEETSSPQRGKQFKAPTQKRTSGLNGAADAVKASLAAVGGPSDKYAMAAEESYEDRQKRLKEAEKKRRAEKRSKRFKKLWQMFGVPETIKLETVAAREAVNALNLTQKDLRHLKREFDEIDVDQSGLLRCGFTPSS